MKVPERWGFCMSGNEIQFCEYLDEAAKGLKEGEKFTYYEIGIGNADTMLAVHSWLSQRGIEHDIIGVDLPNYSGSATQVRVGGISLALVGSETFLNNVSKLADFIFIDACHGAPCVTRDFLAAEPKVKKGGIVCFHDTDPNCQGQHMQEHCGTGIDVRRAVEELGLLNNTRPGWKFLNETWGDKTKGGHGAMWIQKV